MWDTSASVPAGDLVCYVFHHWSGRLVDRSEVVLASATCTPTPREEYDHSGLPAWYLFRSIPRRLCRQAGACTGCLYALGEVTRQDCSAASPVLPPRPQPGGFTIAA